LRTRQLSYYCVGQVDMIFNCARYTPPLLDELTHGV